MAFRYFALRHIGDRAGEPFGIIRADGPTCERYLPGTKEWIESPGDQDYLVGEEPGATVIDEAGANALIERGQLAAVTAEDLAWEPEDDSDDDGVQPATDAAAKDQTAAQTETTPQAPATDKGTA